MNRLARLMVRLYPSRWRTRYGLELTALIEDRGARPLDVLDLLAGALKMHCGLWKLPVVLTLAGLAIATGAAELSPKSYVAETAVHFAPHSQGDVVARALNRSALAEIIRAEGLYEKERAHLPLEDVVELLRRNVHIPVATADGVAKVVFLYPDEAMARRAVLRLAAVLAEPGPVTTAQNFPNLRNFQLTGAAAGLIAGLSIVLFRRRPA